MATSTCTEVEQSGAASCFYAVSATLALYLNLFVLVVQLFQKVPQLHALAPTQSEPPSPWRRRSS